MKNSITFIIMIIGLCACMGRGYQNDKKFRNHINRYRQNEKNDLELVSAESYMRYGGTRIVGRIYEFHLIGNVDGITIEHVWFGDAKPVPAKFSDWDTKFPPTSTKGKNLWVQANRDLYKNFYQDLDSNDYAFVSPAVKCEGDAVITYKVNGAIKHLQVLKVTEGKVEDIRE